MYHLFADETNTSPATDERIKFFVYGGLIIPEEKLEELDGKVAELRAASGYSPEDSLKFDTHSRPGNVSPETFASIKSEIIKYCIQLDCKMLVYVVLHEIAKNQGLSQTIKWGADHIFQKFNAYLEEKNSVGFAIVDRLSDTAEFKLFTEKFTKGLIYPDEIRPLKRIKMFASSCDNASHYSSVMDIVLGSFRYCINQPFNQTAAKSMMKDLVELIWADKNGENLDPFRKGLTLRPVVDKIKIPEYKKEYELLIDHINSLLKD